VKTLSGSWKNILPIHRSWADLKKGNLLQPLVLP